MAPVYPPGHSLAHKPRGPWSPIATSADSASGSSAQCCRTGLTPGSPSPTGRSCVNEARGVLILRQPTEKLQTWLNKYQTDILKYSKGLSDQTQLLLRGDAPGVVQLPALSVVILLQTLEPVRGLLTHGAVQQVLEGGGHVQVLVNGEGHAVVQVMEQVVHPLVDGAGRVVHGYLKLKGQRSSQDLLFKFWLGRWAWQWLADLVQGLAGVHCVPVSGLSWQNSQQGATGEVDRSAGVPREAVGWVRNREPVQNGWSDVWRHRRWDANEKQTQKHTLITVNFRLHFQTVTVGL